MKIFPLKYDYVFKKIFADSEDLSILTAFLSSYFGIHYKEIERKVKLLQGEILKNYPYEREMRVIYLRYFPLKDRSKDLAFFVYNVYFQYLKGFKQLQ